MMMDDPLLKHIHRPADKCICEGQQAEIRALLDFLEQRQARRTASRIRRRAKSKGLVANKSRHKRPDWFIHSGEQMIYCAQSDREALAFLEQKDGE
jgi:hypothetical protein